MGVILIAFSTVVFGRFSHFSLIRRALLLPLSKLTRAAAPRARRYNNNKGNAIEAHKRLILTLSTVLHTRHTN